MKLAGKILRSRQCKCEACKSACENAPCWGTPKEIQKIIDAGYGKLLMADYRDLDKRCYKLITPAVVGYEGTHTPFFALGQCALLNKRKLCPLHKKGLKPCEGRYAYHTMTYNSIKLRNAIARLWNSKLGKEVYASWMEKYWHKKIV